MLNLSEVSMDAKDLHPAFKPLAPFSTRGKTAQADIMGVTGRPRQFSRDALVAAGLFCLVFAGKAGVLTLPYHWDEMSAYIAPSHWLARNGIWSVLPGLHPPTEFFGHPPLIYFTLAALFTLAGEKIWLAHLLTICSSFLAVYFTYLLACRLYGRTTGILASLLLFCSPVFFAQSGMATAEPFVTALGVMCAYYALAGNYPAYLFCAILLVLTKETSAAVISAILLYIYVTERAYSGNSRKLLKYAVPLLVLLAFFALQKTTTGAFLPNPYFEGNTFLRRSTDSFLWIFFHQYRFLMSGIILASFFALGKAAWKKEFFLFFTITLSFAVPFSFIFFTPRYIMPVLPFFFIIGASSLVSMYKDFKRQLMVALMVAGLFLTRMHGTGAGDGSFETDMQYRDVVMVHKEACRYLRAKFPGQPVLALWPMTQELREPSFGYVDRPLNVVGVNDRFNILLYTPQGLPDNSKLKDMAVRQGMVLDKIFERNNKHVEVYIVRSDSGRPPHIPGI